MNRRFKKAVLLALLGIGVTAVATWPSALTFIVQKQLRSLRSQGVPLVWTGLKGDWNSVFFETVSTTLPGPEVATGSDLLPTVTIPIPVEVGSASLRILPGSLLRLSPVLAFDMVVYGGSLSGDASNLQSSPTIRAHLDSLRIDQHPILGSAGIKGGVLTFHTDGLTLSPANQLPQGAFSVEIKHLDPPAVPELKNLLKIETLGPLDFKGQATCSSNTLRIERADLTSPYATITGNGTINSVTSRTPDIRGDFRVTLTEKGVEAFGQWLPIASGGAIQAGAQSFQVQISTRACSAIQSRLLRLVVGTKCLDCSFRP